jgi:hypothetical protein
MAGKGNLVVALYSHPEYYPPTLNALEYLSEAYEHVYVVYRNYTEPGFDWVYPSNVTLLPSSKPLHVRAAEKKGAVSKVMSYLQFTRLFYRTIKKYKADTVLIYDYMPLLAYRLLSPFIKQPRLLWYHNHDVGDAQYLSKTSISWWAWKTEAWIFPKLNVFSLPAVERKQYFPADKLRGHFFFIPNFPSRKVYERYTKNVQRNNALKLLYQGSIGPLHGLEEIIPLLNEKIEGRELYLVLKGFISSEYLEQLQQLAVKYVTVGRLLYVPPSGYRGVIENALSCHIGIGIHKKQDIMNVTLGTASNKIYEYAACGMPALLYDNTHFRNSLQGREWVFFTDTTAPSLLQCLTAIASNYDQYSTQAVNDFNGELCFERHFEPVINHLHAAG